MCCLFLVNALPNVNKFDLIVKKVNSRRNKHFLAIMPAVIHNGGKE